MDRRRAAWVLLALAACSATTTAAPTISSNETALDLHEGSSEGCYYNFQHYGEGDRIMTNEPCLNCTCHNRMLMCYLRVCPFTKAIGQDCSVEKRADQCCPIVTCPDVPVDLLTSTTSSPAEYGGTGVGKVDNYGCSINGRYFPEGSKVPPTPNKPCEHCYCIRNMTTCVMQECTLHVDGCTPIYHKDVCCPVRYHCDHPENEMPLLDDMSTTVRPTQGFLLTTPTPTEPPVTEPAKRECIENGQLYPDGALIKTEKPCVHCYCMKGDIVCVVQECGTPMENEGKNCTSLAPREGQCCPDTYICEGDEVAAEITTPIEGIATTLEPPRRTIIEGSGYRNEPDDMPFTELPTFVSEAEGSGEEQVTTASDLLTPEKESTDSLDERLGTEGEQFASTHIPFSIKTTTELDNGLNTVPSDISDDDGSISLNTTPQEEHKPTEISTERDTTPSIGSKKETTEPSLQDMITFEEQEKATESVLVHDQTETSFTHETTETSIKESTTPKEQEFTTQTDIIMDEITIPSSVPESSEPSILQDTTPTEENKFTEHFIAEDVNTTPSTILEQNGDIASETPIMHRTTYSEPITTESTFNVEQETTSVKFAEGEPAFTGQETEVPKESSSEPSVVITTSKTILDTAKHTTPTVFENEQSSESTSPDIMTTIIETKTETPISIEQDTTLQEETTELPTAEKSTKYDDAKPTETPFASEDEHTPTTASEEEELTTSVPVYPIDKDKTSFESSTSKETEKPSLTDLPTVTAGISDSEMPNAGTTIIPEQETQQQNDSITTEYVVKYTTTKPSEEAESLEPSTQSVIELSPLDHVTEEESITTSKYDIATYQTTEKLDNASETTSINPEYNEIGEDIPQVSSPGRIPGEGDCLLDGITYKNESVIPSTNKCHSGCKCVSSIIKCDPIVCGPQPEYMDKCQLTYDTPDSCCPTYVCDHAGETIPPQPHSQMSGTESPLPTASIDCHGDNCELSKEKLPTEVTPTTPELLEPDKCEANGCALPVQVPSAVPEECTDDKCKQPLVPPSIAPSESVAPLCESPDCKEVKTPEIEESCKEESCKTDKDELCEGEKCTKPLVTIQSCINDEDCKQGNVPGVLSCKDNTCTTSEIEKPCEDDSCKTEPADQGPKVCNDLEDCKEVKIPESSTVPCEGDSCIIVKEECATTECALPPLTSQDQEPCKDESGCEKPVPDTSECSDENCRRSPECVGPECTQLYPTVSTQESSFTSSLSTDSSLPSITEEIIKQTEFPGLFTSLPKEPVTIVPDFTVTGKEGQETESSTSGIDALETKTPEDKTEKIAEFTTQQPEYFEDKTNTMLPEHTDVLLSEMSTPSITEMPSEIVNKSKPEIEQELLTERPKVTEIPEMLSTKSDEMVSEEKLPPTTDTEILDDRITELPESPLVEEETERPEVTVQVTKSDDGTKETEITTNLPSIESQAESEKTTEAQDKTTELSIEQELTTIASVSKITLPIEQDISTLESQTFEPETNTDVSITTSQVQVTIALESEITKQQATEKPDETKTEQKLDTTTEITAAKTKIPEIPKEYYDIITTEQPESYIPTIVDDKPVVHVPLEQDIQTEPPTLPTSDLDESSTTVSLSEQEKLITESPIADVSKLEDKEIVPTTVRTIETSVVTTEQSKEEDLEHVTKEHTTEKSEQQLSEDEKRTELTIPTEPEQLTTERPYSLITETEQEQVDLSHGVTMTESQTTEQAPTHGPATKEPVYANTEAPSSITTIDTELPILPETESPYVPEHKLESTSTQPSDTYYTEKATDSEEYLKVTTISTEIMTDQTSQQTAVPEIITTEEDQVFRIKDHTTITEVPTDLPGIEVTTLKELTSEAPVTSVTPPLYTSGQTTHIPDEVVYEKSTLQTYVTEKEKKTTDKMDTQTDLVTKAEELLTELPESYATSPYSEITEHEELSTKLPDFGQTQTELPKHGQEIETKAPESQYTISPVTVIETESPAVPSTVNPEVVISSEEQPTVTPKLQESDEATQSHVTEKVEPVTTFEDEIATEPETSPTESPAFVTEPQERITVGAEPAVTEQHIDKEILSPTSETSATNIPVEISTEAPMEEVTKVHLEISSTSEPKHEYSETTPYIIELEEHTHKDGEVPSTILAYEEPTTAQSLAYETEPAKISEMVTEKLTTKEQQPEEPITELPSLEEGLTTQAEELPHPTSVTPETDRILEKSTESYLIPSEEPMSTTKQTESQSGDDKFSIGSEDQDVSKSTETPGFEIDKQQTTPVVSYETEKPSEDEIQITSKPLQAPHEVAVPEKEFIPVTSTATTIKTEEEITTPLNLPEQKPSVEVAPSTTLPETPKPIVSELPPTDEVPSPEDESPSEFPPSGGYGQEPDYVEEDQAFGPGTCRYGGKVYVSAQQIPRDDPCDFCFCFRSDIICLQQSCPPPIHGCHEEPIQGFCCPRYECPVSMATTLNVTTTTTTTTTTLPPHFLPHAYKGAAQRRGCQIKGHSYKVGEVVRASSGPCLHCVCGGDGQMKCDPKQCTPEPMLRQMIAAAVSSKRRR